MFNKYNLDKIVLSVSIVSLIWVLFYKLLFLSLFEIFHKASEVGEIFFNILNSIIASGFFYFFVVFLDRKRKENTVNKIILRRLQSIRVGLLFIQKDVFPKLGIEQNDDIPKLDEFIKKCKGIKLSSIGPNIPNAITSQITWYQYFDHFFQSDQINYKILYNHFEYLDIDLIALLDEIQYSHFQRALDNFRESGITDDISGAPGPFWSYLKSLEKISIYCTVLEKKYPEMQIGTHFQTKYSGKNYR